MTPAEIHLLAQRTIGLFALIYISSTFIFLWKNRPWRDERTSVEKVTDLLEGK